MIIIMNLFIMLYNIHSPLEQFEVVSLAYTEIPYFGHVALTNLGLYTIITVFFVLAFHILGFNHKIVPSRWSLSLESSFASVHGLVKSQVGAANERFLPFVYSLFFFLLFANLNGNIPYGFTVTTSAIVSMGLSVIVFIGVTILGLSIHKVHFFSFFVPAGTPLALVPFLARALSLGVRLLANMAAGHSLMKILGGFLFSLFTSSFLISILTIVPFVIFIAIIVLEFAVSFIQAYVFCILTSSYIKDAIDLH